MSLIKWNTPFVNTLDSFLKDDFRFVGKEFHHNVPAVNVKENDTEFALELAAPGLNKESFKIDVENGVLSIIAEQKNSEEEKEEHYTRKEFSYQSFKRSFRLPKTVAEDKINAFYEEGVLNVTIPKREEAQIKRREINVS